MSPIISVGIGGAAQHKVEDRRAATTMQGKPRRRAPQYVGFGWDETVGQSVTTNMKKGPA